jgi:uncharacterized OB-fold protein
MYDRPMWESIRARAFALQKCRACGTFRYPPGPTCAHCLSTEYDWTQLFGRGEILSWVVFHRGYLPAYPPPYNVISVKLDEGPIMVSNLEGTPAQGSWIGKRVVLAYVTMPDGVVLPLFRLAEKNEYDPSGP